MRGAQTNGVPRLRLAILALVLLGACSVKTEGAACVSSDNCPAGQACGHDRKCSEAAAACPQQPVCQDHACSGSALQTCTPDAGGICATSGQETCTENQDCNAPAGLCSCKASRCPAGASAVCAANGELVTCATELGTSCPYEVSAAACSAVRECRPGASAATCECKTSRCTTAASVCDGNTLVNCLVTDGCPHETSAVPCSDPGQTCTGSACACPAAPGSAEGEGCSVAGATQCAGAVLLACRPSVGTSSCLVWTRVEDCSAAGLDCGGATAACSCPPNGSAPFVANADPASVAVRDARAAAGLNAMSPTGVADPVVCRYGTLADALAAAWVAGAGSTARAIGWSAGQVVFTEAALTVHAGVTLTTGDEPLTTTHYGVEPRGEVGASTFITLEPGSSIAGFEIRNATATAIALQTSCAGAADTATVAVDTLVVTGLGGGATPQRFATGLHHSGNCSLSVSNSTFTGAADGGVVIESPAATTSLVMTGNTIRNNQGSTPYTVGPAPDRLAGGLVFKTTLPGTVTFRGNSLLSNQGDQIMVYATGSLDLSAAACLTAGNNTVACYTAPGVALASKAAAVNMAHTSWAQLFPASNADYVTDTAASVAGTTQTCAAFVGTCP